VKNVEDISSVNFPEEKRDGKIDFKGVIKSTC